jgi:hypothetical protein
LINGHRASLDLTHCEAALRNHVINSLIEVGNRGPILTRGLVTLCATFDPIELRCEMGKAIVDGRNIFAGPISIVMDPRKVDTLLGCSFDDGGVEPLPDRHVGTPRRTMRGFARARAHALDIPRAAKLHHLTPSGPRHVTNRAAKSTAQDRRAQSAASTGSFSDSR